jgi:hypothetical protein
MDDEIVKIELTPQDRDKLYVNFYNRMQELSERNLGFKVPKDWPLKGEILLSQLVVLAHKLKMQIIIGDITLAPMV